MIVNQFVIQSFTILQVRKFITMKKLFFALTMSLLCASITGFSQQLTTHKKGVKLMGCHFEIKAVANDDALAWDAINAGIAEIQRIEKLISSWDKDSQTSLINRQAGIKATPVDKELFELIRRAKKIAKLTNGAFDISFASMDRIWKFDGSMKTMPDAKIVEQARAKINWENIILDENNQTVFLKEKGMKIGFGGIGKGYAANRAMHKMKDLGIAGGVVNASGDLIVWGEKADNKDWTIKIANPKDKTKALAWVAVNNMAVVTSGDYERFVLLEGKRYAHIIDPRTGYPTTGVKSVTIICPDAEIADALATSVFVLGKEKGMELLNSLKNIEGVIVTDEDKVLSSKNLTLNYY